MGGHSGKISLAIALVTAVLMGGCATQEELQVVQSSANHAVMTADQATATANQAKATADQALATAQMASGTALAALHHADYHAKQTKHVATRATAKRTNQNRAPNCRCEQHPQTAARTVVKSPNHASPPPVVKREQAPAGVCTAAISTGAAQSTKPINSNSDRSVCRKSPTVVAASQSVKKAPAEGRKLP